MTEQTLTSISTHHRFFDLADPGDYEYDIDEIAHALSNICRYTGHVRRFYSVAEHSVLVSLIVPERLALEGLMHDSAEAFIGDVSRPLKEMLPGYKKIEKRIELSIADWYNLDLHAPEIKVADEQMYWAERKVIANAGVRDVLWHQDRAATRKVEPVGYSPEQAEEMFLRRFNQIMETRGGVSTAADKAA